MSQLDPQTVAVLRPAIIQILEHADLSSISAKKVRVGLSQLPPGRLPPNLDLAASKKQIDEVIRDCFDQMSKSVAPPPQPESKPPSAPPSGGLALPGLGGVRGGHTTPSSSQGAAPAVKKEAAAAPAASTANGTKTKAAPKAAAEPAAKPKKKATKKRAASEVLDEEEAAKKKRAANPNNPFNRPLILAPKLAEVCGGNEMPRHAVVKNLWVYIKANNLQNESNKRQILCDAKLTDIFGKSTVDSFEMAKLIGSHLSKKED
ncbi:uncharacterized protein PFL1_04013 [Pseudozyma flocculosa PF-1]|uniref:Related to UAF30 - subunit of upstream activation factor of RNA polymerase I n=2 Tax=Pseudozyma flocculosa TaxID=84751 RepID=A0A5C3EST1_9BASI|nr:uncharacterized protein PFL1_04013 [Pseudozyma flocculosa PF-1]EPQ28184.1 hypothetical protein PFL1_04013 [Pseudozyma flocculosa PF-1]SPO35318.1 related to UAF30 - subunit of upstream activation factor of RNA polymerase I [Pseudozyma flocculosa]